MFGKNKVFPFNGLHVPAAIVPIISAVATIGGFISSAQQSAAQKKASEAQQKIADAQAARERIQAAREARIRRSEILASAGNSGMGSAGASVAGAASSVSSQLGSNLSYMNTMQYLGKKASDANQEALDAGIMGAGFQMLGKAGGMMGGEDAWKKVFNSGGIPQYPGAPIEDKSWNK